MKYNIWTLFMAKNAPQGNIDAIVSGRFEYLHVQSLVWR
jgi:hypothetical protein